MANKLNNAIADKLIQHLGHEVEIVVYGDDKDIYDVCLECTDCGAVVISAEDFQEDSCSRGESKPTETGIFYVPVAYEMYGRIPVRAKSAKEALEIAGNNVNVLPLPEDAEYLEDTFEIDYEGLVLDENHNVVNSD